MKIKIQMQKRKLYRCCFIGFISSAVAHYIRLERN